jgi:hypothetical protein
MEEKINTIFFVVTRPGQGIIETVEQLAHVVWWASVHVL